MSRDQSSTMSADGIDWKDQARALAADGVTVNEIAERLGRSYSGVYKALHPEKAKAYNRKQNARRHDVKLAWQREHERANRGTCRSCKGPLGIATRRRNKDALCMACRHEARIVRCQQIQKMYLAGVLTKDIADALGWAAGSVSRELDWMRRNGWDLPYRYTAWAEKAAA